ncbi:MAG: hypothetical protein ACJ75B_03765, partial [Flavisolibacter sp.]
MREALDLNFPSNISCSINPSKVLEEHGNKLLSISDFRGKLQYYNEHICSLSHYNYDGLYCYGNDHWHGSGKKFFNKANPECNADFDIYLEERQKEISRLKSLIENKRRYFDKLKCFIEGRAGQISLDVSGLRVENNAFERFIANGGGTVPEHLCGNHTEIDLRPSTPHERQSYNQYLYGYVQQSINGPAKFHWLRKVKYEGFLSFNAVEAFSRQINKALNKDAAIKAEKSRIEWKYHLNSIPDYIRLFYSHKIEDIELWQAALFNAFVNGYEYDFARVVLSEFEMMVFVHVEQVFEYYKQLFDLKDIPYNQVEHASKSILTMCPTVAAFEAYHESFQKLRKQFRV